MPHGFGGHVERAGSEGPQDTAAPRPRANEKKTAPRTLASSVPLFYLEFSQISFYEFRKKEYSVSGMCVEQQVLEITLFHIQVNRG